MLTKFKEEIRRAFTCPPRLRYSHHHVECCSNDFDCRRCWKDYDSRMDKAKEISDDMAKRLEEALQQGYYTVVMEDRFAKWWTSQLISYGLVEGKDFAGVMAKLDDKGKMHLSYTYTPRTELNSIILKIASDIVREPLDESGSDGRAQNTPE